MATMPRAHRRRREKKLMTMDEVNDRFPLTKYKTWISSRAEQGLSTAGGVAAPPSRAASIKAASVRGADGIIPPYQDITLEENARPTTSTSSAVYPQPEKNEVADTVTAMEGHHDHEHHEHDAKTLNSTISPANETRDGEEDMDDDDQIQMAVPTEMLENPGDSCAICLDTLDDEDDVRGLTCGHAFHASCIDPWLTSRRACCPLCKADYYVPKPRAEGDAIAEPERTAGRRPPDVSGARIDVPAPPQFAFLGSRGTSQFRPRMNLAGRFMTISYVDGGDRHGFPTVQRIPRPSRRQRREEQRMLAALVPADPTLSNSNQPTTWRSRMQNTLTMPSVGRWRRNNGNNVTSTEDAPEIGTSAMNPTPGQLEAGAH